MTTQAPLRVAHIITQMELGGAQQNTLYTVSHLNKDHFEACLLTGPGGMLDPDAQQSGIHLYFIPALARPINPIKDMLATISLYRHLRHLQPDVVHTHSSKAGILGRIAAYLAGVPVIIHTYHGFGFTPTQYRWLRRMLIRLEKFCSRLTTHLIFVSDENRRQAGFLGITAGRPSSLIRSGISIEIPETSSCRQALGISEATWVIASVGNFKPQKNPMDLARTATAALKEDANIHFLFVGDGELRPAIEKWVREQSAQENIHFLGWRRDIPEILAASNAFLLTSLWEGLPRSLVEALTAQLPAVCYAVDGVREMIEEGKSGFLVDPGDIDTAKEKILWLKNHPQEAREMGRRGQARLQKEFNIDHMVRQQEELYDKLFQEVPLKEYFKPHGSLTSS